MAKKKLISLVPVGDLQPGAVVLHEGTPKTLASLDAVLDPRGGVYQPVNDGEWYVTFTDGSRAVLSGSAEAA